MRYGQFVFMNMSMFCFRNVSYKLITMKLWTKLGDEFVIWSFGCSIGIICLLCPGFNFKWQLNIEQMQKEISFSWFGTRRSSQVTHRLDVQITFPDQLSWFSHCRKYVTRLHFHSCPDYLFFNAIRNTLPSFCFTPVQDTSFNWFTPWIFLLYGKYLRSLSK